MLVVPPKHNFTSNKKTQSLFWQSLENSGNAIDDFVRTTPEFSVQQRMEVYRTTARSIHVSALMDSYPVCCQILGEEFFKFIAKQYFLQTPAFDENMNNYGEFFPDYLAELLATREELNQLPYLVDLARLEWMYQGVYFAADEIEFDVEKFMQFSEENGDQIKLQLQKSVKPLSSAFPIYEIWQMHQAEHELSEVSLDCPRQYLCVNRKQYKASVELIDADVYTLLHCINQAHTLGEIADYFKDRYDLNYALAQIIEKRWIANY